MSYVSISNLEKNFGTTPVLRGVDYTFEKGEQYVIRGTSGSGKSTLLYILGGLDKGTKGKVEVEGKNLSGLSDEVLAKFRNETVGFVFQFHFLLPSMKCLDNILLPAKIGGQQIGKIKKKVLLYAKMLGVDHCLSKYPHEISGGEQQRVNIVRAISLGPKLLLCDEPTGNLDQKNSQKVITLLRHVAKEVDATLVIVTHDEEIAAQFQNKITIEDGRIIS